MKEPACKGDEIDPQQPRHPNYSDNLHGHHVFITHGLAHVRRETTIRLCSAAFFSDGLLSGCDIRCASDAGAREVADWSSNSGIRACSSSHCTFIGRRIHPGAIAERSEWA